MKNKQLHATTIDELVSIGRKSNLSTLLLWCDLIRICSERGWQVWKTRLLPDLVFDVATTLVLFFLHSDFGPREGLQAVLLQIGMHIWPQPND